MSEALRIARDLWSEISCLADRDEGTIERALVISIEFGHLRSILDLQDQLRPPCHGDPRQNSDSAIHRFTVAKERPDRPWRNLR
jgi:hypothetical protein